MLLKQEQTDSEPYTDIGIIRGECRIDILQQGMHRHEKQELA
jgi:hypothetical protein